MSNLPLICTLVGVAGVAFSIFLAASVRAAPAGNERMQEIACAIKEGAIAYLNRQLKSMGITGLVIFVVIVFALGLKTAIGFLVGAVASFAAGYIGMRVSVLANVRTAEAAKGGLAAGLKTRLQGRIRDRDDRCRSRTDFRRRFLHDLDRQPEVHRGTPSSHSSLSVSEEASYPSSHGSGVVSSRKVPMSVPTSSARSRQASPRTIRRNPATIADNVGDNVGDCAGMAADLFETYAVTAVAAMLLGNLLFPDIAIATVFPLVLGAVSIVASMIAVFFVRLGKNEYIMGALYKGMFGSAILAAIAFYFVTTQLMGGLPEIPR